MVIIIIVHHRDDGNDDSRIIIIIIIITPYRHGSHATDPFDTMVSYLPTMGYGVTTNITHIMVIHHDGTIFITTTTNDHDDTRIIIRHDHISLRVDEHNPS